METRSCSWLYTSGAPRFVCVCGAGALAPVTAMSYVIDRRTFGSSTPSMPFFMRFDDPLKLSQF